MSFYQSKPVKIDPWSAKGNEPLFTQLHNVSVSFLLFLCCLKQGLRLDTVARFREALESEPVNRDILDGDVKWIALKREIRVLYHPQQTFEPIVYPKKEKEKD